MNVASCTPTWLRMTDVRATTGGRASTTSNTVDACLSECESNRACVFVNFQVGARRCWIHTDVIDLNNLRTDDDYNHYILINRCDSSDRKYFTICGGQSRPPNNRPARTHMVMVIFSNKSRKTTITQDWKIGLKTVTYIFGFVFNKNLKTFKVQIVSFLGFCLLCNLIESHLISYCWVMTSRTE